MEENECINCGDYIPTDQGLCKDCQHDANYACDWCGQPVAKWAIGFGLCPKCLKLYEGE